MGRKTNILLATTSFIGGVAAGLLLAPKKGAQNRAWISDHATGFADWADRQHQSARYKGQRKLRKLRKNVQQRIRKNVPNLFEATEHIDLNKHNVISE